MLQLAEFHANAVVSGKPKQPSLKDRKHKLLTFLQGTFQILPFLHVLQYDMMSSLDKFLNVIMVTPTIF